MICEPGLPGVDPRTAILTTGTSKTDYSNLEAELQGRLEYLPRQESPLCQCRPQGQTQSLPATQGWKPGGRQEMYLASVAVPLGVVGADLVPVQYVVLVIQTQRRVVRVDLLVGFSIKGKPMRN